MPGPVHTMPATQEPFHAMPATPGPVHAMPTTPGPVHIKPATPGPKTIENMGELTMTTDMENLQNAIYLDFWTKRAYPSMSSLAIWFMDLLNRIRELETWTSDFSLPSIVWLAGFFPTRNFTFPEHSQNVPTGVE
ncbi:Dynein heavy chain 9, axonemal [Anabarilius grahami]|uniref:Dynein heavy chain 9, axonemal n=1 Tax=Anabarilius grahami TaxID=495550 RepID=A0A3N0XUB8_ANAGA|nr:Dynein heavy chain 9, axonemal [Anabarilius grahami]